MTVATLIFLAFTLEVRDKHDADISAVDGVGVNRSDVCTWCDVLVPRLLEVCFRNGM